MSGDLLLRKFERVADAPDAVPHLREFVLDLAVQGRLVEPEGTSAATSVREIEPMWNIPDGWSVVLVSKLAGPGGIFVDGDWVESKDQDPQGDVRLTQLADVGAGQFRNRSSRFMRGDVADRLHCTYLNEGDILIARMPDPIGRACIFPGDPRPCVTVVDVALIRSTRPDVDSRYVVHALNSSLYAALVLQKAAGTTRQRISRGNLGRLPFPLPPITEQRRIVTKVDELMSLCDQLDVAQKERESHRDALRSVTLHRLTSAQDDAADIATDVHFFLDRSSRLITKPEHVAQVRQAVLDEAVRGRLVRQDSEEEPALNLLKRVHEEKLKEGLETGREWVGKTETPVESLFSPPPGWAWSRIGTVVQRVTVGYVGPMTSQYAPDGVPFLRSQNVRADRFRWDGLITIRPEFHQSIRKSSLRPGDVVIVRSGNVGTACVVPDELPEANCSDLVIAKNPMAVHPRFLSFFLNSLASAHIEAGTVGMALTHFNTRSVATMPIPIPPLVEQGRIVAKVDELMTVCDELELALSAAQDRRARLLAALLHGSLNGNVGSDVLSLADQHSAQSKS